MSMTSGGPPPGPPPPPPPGAQGISPANIATYINDLTPVLLRSDTRVTNHGFANGDAYPIQSVLQAGTAVLVDKFGVPRARCACGNPLIEPKPVPTTPTYQGPPWSGFSPTNITVVNASTTVINIITIIDVRTGTPLGRPTGPQGPDQPLPPGGGTTTTAAPTTTSRPTTTVGLSCPGTSGGLLEALTVNSAQATGPTSRTWPAGCGYRIVFSGDADWNVNNAFQGGFDTHYCYDPQYCPRTILYNDGGGGGLKVNGVYPWEAFGTAPPAYSSSHSYAYSVASLPGNRIAMSVNDIAYSDNSGLYTVEIYRA